MRKNICTLKLGMGLGGGALALGHVVISLDSCLQL
jgi:hypothetical protein